jgi:hypothetical protein
MLRPQTIQAAAQKSNHKDSLLRPPLNNSGSCSDLNPYLQLLRHQTILASQILKTIPAVALASNHSDSCSDLRLDKQLLRSRVKPQQQLLRPQAAPTAAQTLINNGICSHLEI